MVYVYLLMCIRSVSKCKEIYAWGEVLLGVIMFSMEWSSYLHLETFIAA